MKHMNYSSITAMLRRIHRAKAISDETGIPVRELIERHHELRKNCYRSTGSQNNAAISSRPPADSAAA